jgi:hypothetical protein
MRYSAHKRRSSNIKELCYTYPFGLLDPTVFWGNHPIHPTAIVTLIQSI